MNKWQRMILPVAVAALGILCSSRALPQDGATSTAGKDLLVAESRSVIEDAAFTRSAFFQEDEETSPFKEEPAPTPAPEELAPVSPEEPAELIVTDEPPEPTTPDGVQDKPASSDYGGPDEFPEDDWYRPDLGYAAAGGGNCDACNARPPRRGFTLGGWIDQGDTVSAFHSADRFHGPVGFNDRDGEYQLNQLWVYAERPVDTSGRGWDIGGRVDLMYGTDHRFLMSRGLEVERNLDDKWNEERFYGLAMPQLYADVAYNDLTVRMGHFLTIVGYETITAPDNFFYSHSYSMLYGEPFTHTGLLASYRPSDRITISGGFDRGWNNWEDNNDKLSFLGGAAWTSCDEATSVSFAVSSGPYDNAGELNRVMYSIVFAQQISQRLLWVLQHDYGLDNDGARDLGGGVVENAEWYGISQYFVYNMTPIWDLGVRVEWFSDDDGTRVGGIGVPHGWALGPNVGPDSPYNQLGWAGDFFEVSLGLNWKPCPNIVARPECRWDWYRGPRDGLNRLPYDTGHRWNQFTFGTDIIVTF